MLHWLQKTVYPVKRCLRFRKNRQKKGMSNMRSNGNILRLLLVVLLSLSLALSACQTSQTPTEPSIDPSDPALSHTDPPGETNPDQEIDPEEEEYPDWTDPEEEYPEWTDPDWDEVIDSETIPQEDEVIDSETIPEGDEEIESETNPPQVTDPPQETDPPQDTNYPTVLAPEVSTNNMVFLLQQDNTYKLMSWSGSGDSVTVPATVGHGKVTSVADGCFKNRTDLRAVVISAGITKLGNEVFSGCTSLYSVTIPDSVSTIGYSAFQGTPWYTSRASQSQWLIVGDGVLLKYSGTGATEVTVPASVKYISDAFRGNSKLVRINVKSTCKTIGQYAFADCPKLKIIGLPMKLDYIASNSVVGCPILQNIKNIDDNPATPETITPIETVPPVQAKPEGVTPASVKVMSWNIWHENVWTGQCTNWERLAKVVDVVEYYNPDVLMTQETTDWWVIYLMQNLPSQYTWAYTHSNGHDEAMPELNKNNKHADETHSAIFYNQEKLELLDNGLFWLSETPNVMSKYYESYCFRIISWAKFRDKATGREFICIDVHLDGETDEPYKILMDFVTKNIETPTILAGDFNRKTGTPIMNSLNAYAPLKDASNGTESKSNIDWVYVSRNTVEVLSYKHGVVEGIEKPSDHKPRVVELLIY